MTGARHRSMLGQAVGRAECACGVQGSPWEISEHVRRYAAADARTEIKVGRIRNGQLTRDRERTHVELEQLSERVFVLVALPAGTPLDDALRVARETLEGLPRPHGLRDADPLAAGE